MFTNIPDNKYYVLQTTPTTKCERFLLFFKKELYDSTLLDCTESRYKKGVKTITRTYRVNTYKYLKGKRYIISSKILMNIDYKRKTK